MYRYHQCLAMHETCHLCRGGYDFAVVCLSVCQFAHSCGCTSTKKLLLLGASPLTRGLGPRWGLRLQTPFRRSVCYSPHIFRSDNANGALRLGR